jgi:hypothetical protein
LVSNDERRGEILRYVIDRQRTNQKTTKSIVMRHMKKKKLSSGETTHNIIKDLIDEGKLNVEILNSQVHFLTISPNFGLPQLERHLLVQAIIQVHSYLENISAENEGLAVFLMQCITDDKLRSMINDHYRDTGGAQFDIVWKQKPQKKGKLKPEPK